MKKYTLQDWRKRVQDRSDISGHVVHLTKDTAEGDSYSNLLNILKERKIRGSDTDSGFIIGSNKAVCFQDAPLYGICQNVYYDQKMNELYQTRKRYRPVGLAFTKSYIYKMGGRPVVYEETNKAKRMLDNSEWWRIVNFDISDNENYVDWTHEREWRLKGDFDFDIGEAYVLLVHSPIYKKFIKDGADILDQIKGIVVLQPILE